MAKNAELLYWGYNSCPVRLYVEVGKVERKSEKVFWATITTRFNVENDQYHTDRKLSGVIDVDMGNTTPNRLLQYSRPSATGGETATYTYNNLLTSNAAVTKEIPITFKYWETSNTDRDPDGTYTFTVKVKVPAWTSSSGGSGSGGSGSGGSGSGGSLSGEYYIVKKGDTLWGIAKAHLPAGATNAEIQKEVNRLASLNKLKDPNKIYVGQKIYLGTSGGGSSTSSSSTLKIIQFGPLSNVDNTLFAAWEWSKNDTESYKAHWDYDVGNGIWLSGDHKTISIDEDDPEMAKQCTYSIPADAVRVRFKVKPIAKKNKDSDGNESPKWTVNWSEAKIWTNELPLNTPSTPSVKIDKYKLTASLENIDIDGATGIVFQIVKNDSDKSLHTSKEVAIVTRTASYSYNVDPGADYKVRCYASNSEKGSKSDWSDYSSNTSTIPATPSDKPVLQATSETSVKLTWTETPAAKTYDIEYATKKEYFDITDETTVKNDVETTTFEIRGLESGTTYFFRIRAVNDSGSSGWSEAESIVIGTEPIAPTTWSSTTTAIVGEPLTLYWMHNTEDGSSQTLAELELTINGKVISPAITIKNFTSEEEKDKTRSCSIDTVSGHLRWVEDPQNDEDDGNREFYLGTTFVEGSKIQWRVRTAGITNKYGDWSVQRTIDIYAPPTLELNVTTLFEEEIEVLEMFPFMIYAIAGPSTQTPTGYHLEIISNDFYETVDNVGNQKIVNKGECVYSKYFDTDYRLLVEMSASNISLENNVSYTVKCTVSMNSGLTATTSKDFTVSWFDTYCEPNAEVKIDKDSFTATIRPYCELTQMIYHKVERDGLRYVVTDNIYDFVSGTIVKRAKTTTGEQVYSGVAPDGEEIYFAIVKEVTPITEVYLSVYRREYDGSFTELATDLIGGENTTIVDPHPALDYARYRIVATDMWTGTVSYYDLPGYPVGGTAVIIQWAEEWSKFDAVEDAVMEQPAWSGSLLKLPYNIDVSDSHQPDVELVEYIGRSHPLTYYGTQLGTTSSWNMVIPKSDKETLYALRRLARWLGDVYVREPSGSGYWANVTVSFSQKHKSVTIPVTLSLTRVEGGA